MMDFHHLPVMLNECIAALNLKPDGVYLDGTAGGAGHSREIAMRLQGGLLFALDQDPAALKTASERLQGLPAVVLEGNFRHVAGILLPEAEKRGLGGKDGLLDGALLDLGVSSHQLDTAERGFSYHGDAPLDMRMSQSGSTAADLVNGASRQELSDILRDYGEEKYAWNIAGAIVRERETEPILRTGRLAQVIASAVPPQVRRKEKNPARKSFQALRIAVNGEMEALDEGLEEVFSLLKPGGRLAVLTFHSLEDRMVKQRFRQWATACTCPPDFPVCVCGGRAKAKLVGKTPAVAGEEELSVNRRSRSAKLRVVEKCEMN